MSNLNLKIAEKSLIEMKETTGANAVIFTPPGLQNTPQSTQIEFTGAEFISDEVLIKLINIAKELDLLVILKPTVNCRNGVWRAFINFFDIDVPCEPKWKDWFSSHLEFHTHYAAIAEQTNCYMYICGCEMVMADRKIKHFEELISQVRTIYSGLVTYNCDKYQEGEIGFWNSVDVIASSGYYPQGEIADNFNRIEKIAKQYNKEVFFAEAGCMSSLGCEKIPNNWELKGLVSQETQANYLDEFLTEARKREFISGIGIWDWAYNSEYDIAQGYSVNGKKAVKVIKDHFNKW